MNGELYPGEFEAMEHNGRMDALEQEQGMTREEAKAWFKVLLKDEYAFNSADREAFVMAIKALEQEPILDKIRAEIEATPTEIWNEDKMTYILAGYFKKQVLQIIDKYRQGEVI